MKKLMKIACIAICASWGMSSCASKQVVIQPEGPRYTSPVPGGSSSELPCTVYDTKEYFAATGIAYGNAKEKNKIQQQALQNAQDIVAKKLRHPVKGAGRTFFMKTSENGEADFSTKDYEDISSAIDGVLNNTGHSCLEWSGVDEKGNIECYIGIQVEKEELTNAITQALSQSQSITVRNNITSLGEIILQSFIEASTK